MQTYLRGLRNLALKTVLLRDFKLSDVRKRWRENNITAVNLLISSEMKTAQEKILQAM